MYVRINLKVRVKLTVASPSILHPTRGIQQQGFSFLKLSLLLLLLLCCYCCCCVRVCVHVCVLAMSFSSWQELNAPAFITLDVAYQPNFELE